MIAQLDTPAGLYGRPDDAELAQFLGESNVLEGEVRDGVATTRLGRLPVGAWTGPAEGGQARVMVRPEQIVLGDAAAGALEGTVPATSTTATTPWSGCGPGPTACPTWSCGSPVGRRWSRGTGWGSPSTARWWHGRPGPAEAASPSE